MGLTKSPPELAVLKSRHVSGWQTGYLNIKSCFFASRLCSAARSALVQSGAVAAPSQPCKLLPAA